MIAGLLGHEDEKTASRYDHHQNIPEPKVEASERVGATIADLLGGKEPPDNVVKIS